MFSFCSIISSIYSSALKASEKKNHWLKTKHNHLLFFYASMVLFFQSVPFVIMMSFSDCRKCCKIGLASFFFTFEYFFHFLYLWSFLGCFFFFCGKFYYLFNHFFCLFILIDMIWIYVNVIILPVWKNTKQKETSQHTYSTYKT